MIESNPSSMRERNAPWNLWRPVDPSIAAADWQRAARHARYVLEDLPAANGDGDLLDITDAILTEAQFGERHWELSGARRFYYNVARQFIPSAIRPALRRVFLAPQREHSMLRWPVDDRYVRFQFEMLRFLLESRGASSLPHVNLWPNGERFAFALSHDVETGKGQAFVREVAALEERYGFRSSFNFVPERYGLDTALMDELRGRGFEIGVHGLRHDGRLFLSRRRFERRARRINGYLERWGASGFRSPFTHRNPEWMQSLAMEYDSSFFDTDPFETIPGGTMSIWPFTMGRFIELPMTLAQDHTVISTMGETTPRIWTDKVDFIERHCGMAMMVTHPDYLLDPSFFAIYEEFLRRMSVRHNYWHALPRTVAEWWRRRDALPAGSLAGVDYEDLLPGASVGTILLNDDGRAIAESAGSLVIDPAAGSRYRRAIPGWPTH